MPELIPFTITRSKWLRGEDGSNSVLLRSEDGRQCCLGQFAEKVCGISRGDLIDHASLMSIAELLPDDVYAWAITETSDRGETDSISATDLMTLNDDPQIANDVREAKLIEKFAALGYALAFQD